MLYNFRAQGFIARIFLCSWLFLTAGSALLPAQTSCPVSDGWVKPASGNLFNDEQEIWLGDAIADLIENEYTIVKDPAENAYLQKIGARLLAVLPPTKIRFRFVLIDSPEVNGFSLAGGRVYITRKLVTSAHSEDEIAAVLAHEIGHIVTHQSAAEMSELMRRLMGVTSIGDRADVYDKFRRLMDARRNDKSHHDDPDSDANQNVADRVAVYAAAAAGYDPQAYAEFWNRSFFVQGKTGNALSDFFRLTTPSQKRLRQLQQLIAELPKDCGTTTTTASSDFLQWQHLVTANQRQVVTAEAVVDEKVLVLQPPLRMDLQRLRFSPDGKYLFAQDESSIFVMQRDPLKFIFRFDADNAKPAEWGPDSTKIVFYTPKLHVEEWSITQQKLLSAREIVVKDDCIQSVLSPDGRTLVCVSVGVVYGFSVVPFNLALIDTESNQVIYQKNDFLHSSAYSLWTWIVRHDIGLSEDPFNRALSQDGNYLIIGDFDGKLAFDLRTRTPIKLGGDFDRDVVGTYAFQEQGAAGSGFGNLFVSSGWFSFPDGKRLGKWNVGFGTLNSVSKGDYLITRGGEHDDAFVVNFQMQKMVELPKIKTLDMWQSSIAMEMPDGSVVLGTFDPLKPIQLSGKQTLPFSPLGSTRVIELSPDGHYLAISGRSRGAVWDMKSGERLYYLRGFSGAAFHSDGNLYLDLPKYDKTERSIVRLGLGKNEITKLDYPLNGAMFMRAGHMMEWKEQGKGKLLLTVHDIATGKELWNRLFEKEIPGSARNYADNNLLFVWRTSSIGGKAELKNSPELEAQASALKDKDAGLVIEVVSIDKGEILKSVVLARPTAYNGVTDLDQEQETILVNTTDNRVLLFSAKTGALIQQVFGYVVGVDAQAGLFCVKNRNDEVLVYDLTGKEVSHRQTGTTVRLARFEDSGKKLLLLGSDQKIRVVDLQQTTAAAAAP